MKRILIATLALTVGVFGLITAVDWVLAEQPPAGSENTTDEFSPAANRRLPLPMATMTNGFPVVSDPADVALDREAKQLAARVRAAKEPERSKLRAELEQLTEKHFEQRQQRRKQEIDELADRVDKLRVAHHRRQESKPDIIKRRLAELLDEENELKWDDTPVAAQSLKPTDTTMTASFPHRLERPVATPKLALDGEWLVTLPAGFEFVGKIAQQEDGTFTFTDMRNLSGTFRFSKTNSDTLERVLDPKDDLRDQYEWLILNEKVMVLTYAPQHIGADYRGATLRRGAKPKAPPALEPPKPSGDLLIPDTLPNERSKIERDLRIRQAEVILRQRQKDLAQMEESNRKVPGTIPDNVIGRAQSEVELSALELEAAKVGADLARPNQTEGLAK